MVEELSYVEESKLSFRLRKMGVKFDPTCKNARMLKLIFAFRSLQSPSNMFENISISPLTVEQVENVWQRVSSCLHFRSLYDISQSREWVSTMCSLFNQADVLELFKHQVFMPAIKHVQNVDHEDPELVVYVLVCNLNQAWDTFMHLAIKYSGLFDAYTEEELLVFKMTVFVDAIKMALYPGEYSDECNEDEEGCYSPQQFEPESFFV